MKLIKKIQLIKTQKNNLSQFKLIFQTYNSIMSNINQIEINYEV